MTEHLYIGVVGFACMGQFTVSRLSRVHHPYPDLPVVSQLPTVADNAPSSRLEVAGSAFGYDRDAAYVRGLLAR